MIATHHDADRACVKAERKAAEKGPLAALVSLLEWVMVVRDDAIKHTSRGHDFVLAMLEVTCPAQPYLSGEGLAEKPCHAAVLIRDDALDPADGIVDRASDRQWGFFAVARSPAGAAPGARTKPPPDH